MRIAHRIMGDRKLRHRRWFMSWMFVCSKLLLSDAQILKDNLSRDYPPPCSLPLDKRYLGLAALPRSEHNSSGVKTTPDTVK